MTWEVLLDEALWIQVAVVAAVALVSYWLLRTVLSLVIARFLVLAERSERRLTAVVAQMLTHTSRWLLLAFALVIGLKMADLPARWEVMLSHGWFIVLAVQAARWVDAGVRLWMDSLAREGAMRNPVTTTLIGIMVRIVVWTTMLLSILANLGVNITALVASLGVGGIAIALAVQTLLSDVFASMSIGIDKPFEVGDFVVSGDVAGTIEHIGLKSTRIRALSGEQVVCSNADLLGRVVHNYKRMRTRRIVFRFGVAYDTSSAKARQVGQLVERIIGRLQEVKFDRAHLLAFEESQMTFEVVYIMQTADYNRYMDIQQEINLGLIDGLKELGVRFAFPTRHLEFIGGRFPEVKLGGQVATPANRQDWTRMLPDR